MLSTRKLLVLDVLWQGLEQDSGLVQPAVLVMLAAPVVPVLVVLTVLDMLVMVQVVEVEM